MVGAVLCLFSTQMHAQDPVGAIEGRVTDPSASSLAGAHVAAKNLDTELTKEAVTGTSGLFRISLLPVGRYRLTVDALRFAVLVRESMAVNVSQTVRVELQLDLAEVKSTLQVTGEAPLVDASTNTLGAVVTGRQIVDLPLNGRNFTQLGLLQAGAAPLTGGLVQAGGPMRQGETYAVNGTRPEQNMYVLDGAQNVNRMDGGYALKIPVDAIAEFRILTQTAAPEYGGTGGATTAVVTRSGTNQFHGTVYEFLRNDKLDTRNYFSTGVEPLKQNQFGGTGGGPLKQDQLFLFGYYEGFRNKQGLTTSATVPTPLERAGDFSAMGSPLINFAAGGTTFPNNRIPAPAMNAVARNVLGLYPLGNVSPSVYRTTVVGTNFYDQAGARLDFNVSSNDQLFARYSYSGGYDINPVSVRGTTIPGFPTRDNLTTHSVEVASIHVFSPSVTNSFRATFLRYLFDFDRRLNQTPPSALGFEFDSASALGQGPPFFNIVGYSPVGGAITGPRDSAQNSFEEQEALSWTKGRHSARVGAEFIRTQINMFQAIAPNAFFVFASTFPTNNAIANLLLGAPVTFYQGLGDFHRGLRDWSLGVYAQDEWRVTPRLTLNYGIRYERVNPIREIANRLNGFVPGVQSQVFPSAPAGLQFPGDPGMGSGIASDANAWMPRIGFAWDPTGSGKWAVRSSYGIFYDQFQNGPGVASQGPISSSALGPVQSIQRRGAEFCQSLFRAYVPGAKHVCAALYGVRHRSGSTTAVCAELELRDSAFIVRPLSAGGAICGIERDSSAPQY